MNKSVCVLFITILLLLSSCSECQTEYNWAMQNDGQKVCGVKGVAGIDIGATLIGMHIKRVAVPASHWSGTGNL